MLFLNHSKKYDWGKCNPGSGLLSGYLRAQGLYLAMVRLGLGRLGGYILLGYLLYSPEVPPVITFNIFGCLFP